MFGPGSWLTGGGGRRLVPDDPVRAACNGTALLDRLLSLGSNASGSRSGRRKLSAFHHDSPWRAHVCVGGQRVMFAGGGGEQVYVVNPAALPTVETTAYKFEFHLPACISLNLFNAPFFFLIRSDMTKFS